MYYASFIFLLALSNGYVTSIALMHGPKVVEGNQELAASFLVAFLLVGLSVGALLSAPVVKLL